ncbi:MULTISPECIES: MBL fold metallo-hydrolase [unclassified Avibacterium]|uniref:MBL fold metallo-hydrolase n=1 Tax=unclassified Avibacterium TaxID=2685287 RepID=UPI0020271589|nr:MULTISPECIES: MBL fold metallo-hydrolase [unclassified Avibacterium]MCW9699112.1 MBL fold metallo-hydrolase [Avibacterium sp. 20-129]URL06695.1 MBL fold metallo-hydrolase [Avibacterium sp. 21-595]
MRTKTLLATALLGALLSVQAYASDSYQHIRNATAKVSYAGQTFLIDPMLAKKGAYEGFANTLNSQLRNPLTELPMPMNEAWQGVTAVVVTHTHLDHWDEAAQKYLPKDLPIIVQNQDDAKLIREQGFNDVRVLNETLKIGDVSLHKTGGAHGTKEMYAVAPLGQLLGDAMGVVLRAKDRKTLYIMGDTLWTADVNKALIKYKPDVLVMNTGSARVNGFNEGIIMGKEDVAHAHQAMPKAKIIAVHMDAVNHGAVSRQAMRAFVQKSGLKDWVAVPEDGEKIPF